MKMVNYQLIPVNLKKKVTWEDGKSERVLYTLKSLKTSK